jgi:hypothetical protein
VTGEGFTASISLIKSQPGKPAVSRRHSFAYAAASSSIRHLDVISLRLLKYVAIALAACLFLKVLLIFKARPIGMLEWAAGVAFGVLFHLLIIVRLPIFRTFYADRSLSLTPRPRSFADLQAAPVLSSIFAGGAAALLCAALHGAHVIEVAMCAGLAAGVMSFYSTFR